MTHIPDPDLHQQAGEKNSAAGINRNKYNHATRNKKFFR